MRYHLCHFSLRPFYILPINCNIPASCAKRKGSPASQERQRQAYPPSTFHHLYHTICTIISLSVVREKTLRSQSFQVTPDKNRKRGREENAIHQLRSNLDGVLPGPLPRCGLISCSVGLVDVGNLGDKRVVGVGVSEHRADGEENCLISRHKRRGPMDGIPLEIVRAGDH